MFNWVSRPQAAFHVNAAATGLILLVMTLAMNGLAIWLQDPQEHALTSSPAPEML
jgi:phosphate transport system permease protein